AGGVGADEVAGDAIARGGGPGERDAVRGVARDQVAFGGIAEAVGVGGDAGEGGSVDDDAADVGGGRRAVGAEGTAPGSGGGGGRAAEDDAHDERVDAQAAHFILGRGDEQAVATAGAVQGDDRGAGKARGGAAVDGGAAGGIVEGR